MRKHGVTRSLGILLLLGAGAARVTAQEADDATRRARAREEWYNETYRSGGRERPERLRNGGLWSPDFRRFMMEAAARERLKWGALIPGNGEAAEVGGSLDRAEAGGGAGWLNIGPTKANYIFNGITLFVTDAGRVRSFAPHPQDPSVLYVAFSGGGVWKTVNGGTTWTAMTEGVGSLSVGSLAMDPSNASVLYLGLGDPFDGTGIGLVKSINGGTTWSNPVFLGTASVIPQVLVSPANPAIVLVATDKGLFRSTDSGGSFNPVTIVTGQPDIPYIWSIASTGGSNLVLSLAASPLATNGNTQGQVWVSSDNGVTWTRGSNVVNAGGLARITVAAAPSSPNIVYALAANPGGDLANMYRSINGGLNWRSLRTTGPRKVYTNPNTTASRPAQLFNTQGWYDQMLIVDPTNPNRFFFGGALHTATSADGGHTYSMVSEWLGRYGRPYVHADAHAAAYDVAGNLYFGTDGGIFKSPDNGASFTDVLNIGITTHLIYHLGSSTANPSLVVGGFQDNGTRVRSASTSTFKQTIGGDGFGCDIKSSDPTQMLGTVQNLSMRKSTDGGLHFSLACTGLPCGGGPFLSRVVPWTGSATGDVVFTHSPTAVYKSVDYAGSWVSTTAVPANTIRNIGVAQSNVNVLGIVTSGGHTYLSSNGGTLWTETTVVPNNQLSLSFIWFDRVDPTIVYVASVAPFATATHLWKSVNSGLNWTAIDGGGFPTGVPVDVIKTDPAVPNTLYAGTHLGVYRSDDGGGTWVRHGAGMPLVEVTDVYISADNSLVRASTFGRGFWELIP